ncbi:MAG TPA: SIMPL domain-containing protein [Anaerolineae bacterium]
MKRISRFLAVTLLVTLILLLLAFGGSWLTEQATAQDDGTPTEAERTISVSGQGRVSARPDLAVVWLGVQTEADTAQEALEENSIQMQEVISATLEAGVEEDDVQTQVVRLQPIYDQPQDVQQRELQGYRATNIVEVTVRDLDDLGTLLDAAVEVGGNTIENIRFEIDDTDEVLVQAREAAVNNAREKAEQLTSLLDVELGEVLSISETSFTPPTPVVFEEPAAERLAAAVPVQPGTQSIEASVQIIWQIR